MGEDPTLDWLDLLDLAELIPQPRTPLPDS